MTNCLCYCNCWIFHRCRVLLFIDLQLKDAFKLNTHNHFVWNISERQEEFSHWQTKELLHTWFMLCVCIHKTKTIHELFSFILDETVTHFLFFFCFFCVFSLPHTTHPLTISKQKFSVVVCNLQIFHIFRISNKSFDLFHLFDFRNILFKNRTHCMKRLVINLIVVKWLQGFEDGSFICNHWDIYSNTTLYQDTQYIRRTRQRRPNRQVSASHPKLTGWLPLLKWL